MECTCIFRVETTEKTIEILALILNVPINANYSYETSDGQKYLLEDAAELDGILHPFLAGSHGGKTVSGVIYSIANTFISKQALRKLEKLLQAATSQRVDDKLDDCFDNLMVFESKKVNEFKITTDTRVDASEITVRRWFVPVKSK